MKWSTVVLVALAYANGYLDGLIKAHNDEVTREAARISRMAQTAAGHH